MNQQQPHSQANDEHRGTAEQPSFSPYQQTPQAPPYSQPLPTNGKALAAMIVGISALVIPFIGFIPGIVGIILSSLAFKELRQKPQQGRGFAIAGLVCSIISVALYAIAFLFFIFIYAVGSASYSSTYY